MQKKDNDDMGHGKGITQTEKEKETDLNWHLIKKRIQVSQNTTSFKLTGKQGLRKNITVTGYSCYLQKEGLEILDSSVLCLGRSDVIAVARCARIFESLDVYSCSQILLPRVYNKEVSVRVFKKATGRRTQCGLTTAILWKSR